MRNESFARGSVEENDTSTRVKSGYGEIDLQWGQLCLRWVYVGLWAMCRGGVQKSPGQGAMGVKGHLERWTTMSSAVWQYWQESLLLIIQSGGNWIRERYWLGVVRGESYRSRWGLNLELLTLEIIVPSTWVYLSVAWWLLPQCKRILWLIYIVDIWNTPAKILYRAVNEGWQEQIGCLPFGVLLKDFW